MSIHKDIKFEDESCKHLAANDWLYAEEDAADYLLQERRTALISAAVTGKIDVREFTSKEAMV